MNIHDSEQLLVEVDSDLPTTIRWSAEDDTVISVDDTGVVTGLRSGTSYVMVEVSAGDVSFTDRCRIDVVEEDSITGVQLGTSALTTELFRTDYAQFDVILLLEQNLTSAFSVDREMPEDNGIAIDDAWFEDISADMWFDLVVKDDRTLQVVPTEFAIYNPGFVEGSYTSRVTVLVCGEEYTTESALTLTVKKSTPKLKATSLNFNSFYTNQGQPIVITGATVTGIEEDSLPDWLALSDNELFLCSDAPAKSTSGKANLLVDTEEWAIPAAVSVPVKLIYKEPGLKLSKSSVTFASGNSQGVSLKLLCTSKQDTLEQLNPESGNWLKRISFKQRKPGTIYEPNQ